MTTASTDPDFEAVWQRVSDREKILIQELEEVRRDKDDLQHYKDLREKWNGGGQSPIPGRSGGRHSHLRVEDLSGCSTQHEALERIAQLSGGLVNPTEASRLIWDAGLSKATKLNSIVSTVSGYLLKGDMWERADTGVYRLKKCNDDRFADPHPMGEERPFVQCSQTE